MEKRLKRRCKISSLVIEPVSVSRTSSVPVHRRAAWNRRPSRGETVLAASRRKHLIRFGLVFPRGCLFIRVANDKGRYHSLITGLRVRVNTRHNR